MICNDLWRRMGASGLWRRMVGQLIPPRRKAPILPLGACCHSSLVLHSRPLASLSALDCNVDLLLAQRYRASLRLLHGSIVPYSACCTVVYPLSVLHSRSMGSLPHLGCCVWPLAWAAAASDGGRRDGRLEGGG